MDQHIIDRISDRLTVWVGSTASLVVHTILFIASFACHWLLGAPLESILLVVTTIVSLEAIYISIFIQRAVNQQGKRLIDVEEDIAEVDRALDEVEETLDDVEEALDDQEEDIAELPADTLKHLEQPLQDLLNQIKELADQLPKTGKRPSGTPKVK